MPIFKETNSKLKKLKTISVSKEKDLQNLIEENLDEVLGMFFLATEYATTFGGRIDTLAVDYNGAPVIIEYKKNKNVNVINQALSYLRWLQAQKQEFFEMLVLKTLGQETAKQLSIDWKNPRVICIAESYSKFDIDTVEVIPMRIELFRFRYYDDGIFSLEPLAVSQQSGKTESLSFAEKSVIDTSIEKFTNKVSEEMQDVFENLRAKIFELDENIKEKVTKNYVAYRVTNNFAEVYFFKNQLRINLRQLDYIDEEQLIEKVPDSYKWTMNRQVHLKSEANIEYIYGLIVQSYRDVL